MSETSSSTGAFSRPVTADILLTLTAPLSHHDPAVTDGSNTLLFNRALQIVSRATPAAMPARSEIDAFAARHTAPEDFAPLLSDLSYPEFVATAIVRLFIDEYNGADGSGLFTGMERYARLESRARLSAVRTISLRTWWDALTATMQVPIHGSASDAALLSFFGLSAGAQELALRAIERDYRSIVAIARMWHQRTKEQSPDYVLKSGAEQAGASVAVAFRAEDVAQIASEAMTVDVPAVQGNSLRHQIVRAPAWRHLVGVLGIDPAFPGEGSLPPGVEGIFTNGGNIAGGSKQPTNPHQHAWAIRRTFPSLDLLGGCTDSFDLGESRLKISGWLVCRENARALDAMGYSLEGASLSAFDMLTEVTQTRQATRDGEGQMIYTCEALAAGAQIAVRATLDAFTPQLTRGALTCAIETFRQSATIGGQARAGFGGVDVRAIYPWDGADDDALAYTTYLESNADGLRESMRDGTLGASVRCLS